MNFYGLLKSQAEILGEKIFLTIDGHNFSYKNFLAAVDNFASGGKFFSQAVNFFAAQKKNPSNIFQVATSGSTGKSFSL